MLRQVLSVMLIIAAGFAQTKPNLAGDWKMNRAKSSWGLWGEPPNEMTAAISHRGRDIRIEVTSVVNYKSRVRKYAINDTECMFTVEGESTACKAEWEGSILALTHKIPAKDGNTGKPSEMVWKVRWTLSDDGKTLTVVSRPEEFASPNFDQRAVLEKQ